MSNDKRSVFTDALETLGTIIDETQKRDAIHLAVEPMIAKENLQPGDHINSKGEKCLPYENGAVGIVDPFLKAPSILRDNGVRAGERFWLVLYPRTIKSLRHVWEHPAFSPSELNLDIEQSKKWIEDYVNSINQKDSMYDETLSYDEIMKAAHCYIDSEARDYPIYLNKNDLLENEYVDSEFWKHFHIITGRKKPEIMSDNFFSCAC